MRFLWASDRSMVAGRDIVINIDKTDPSVIRAMVEQVLAERAGRPGTRIRLKNTRDLTIEDMGDFTNRIAAATYVQSGNNRSKFRDYADLYLNQSVATEKIGRTFRGIDQALKKKEFRRAHRLLHRLLDVEGLADARDDIIQNYLMSGYIDYANTGNTTGMLTLIQEAEAKYFGNVHEGIEYLLIEVQQEIATRQDDDALLRENERLLLAFLSRNEIAPEDSGLLGLLYRRLGERGSLEHLHKAEKVFRAILQKRTKFNVEEANNFGIALIRNYEVTGDASKLDEALHILRGIDFEKQDHPLPDFLSLPKAINNIGNAYKQKLKLTKQTDFYAQAIENYVRAETYWDEMSAPYEWAMIQKNKAEARLEYYYVGGNDAVLLVAAAEISASLRYRTEAQSPYQFARSMAVKAKIDQALQKDVGKG